MIDSPYLIKPGDKVKLDKYDTSDTGKFKNKDDGLKACEKNLARLRELQDVLYAGSQRSLLVVLQAMDAGGKDGTIEHVFSGVNPQGCAVTSFKAPTLGELAHDFLWRIHSAVPRKGMIGIFNRSHYEDILAVRVRKLAPKDVWSARYDHINNFERLLADSGTAIVKFCLHISKEEQKERMEARLADKEKNWKFNIGDLDDRKLWDDFQEAYSDVLQKCSTKVAPWFVVPADKKWFRNWVVSDTIVRTLEEMDLKYPKPQEGLDKVKVV